MRELNTSDFIVTNPVELNEVPTMLETGKSKKENKKALKKIGKKLGKLQNTMYAHNRYGVLVCLQGMDTKHHCPLPHGILYQPTINTLQDTSLQKSFLRK